MTCSVANHLESGKQPKQCEAQNFLWYKQKTMYICFDIKTNNVLGLWLNVS